MSKFGAIMAKYKVLTGIDYPPNRRAEAGDVVDDLPSKSIKWLRESGCIEPFDPSTPDPEPEPEPEPEPVVEETPVAEVEPEGDDQ